MKTIKRILMAGMLVVSLSANANEKRAIAVDNGDVTITKENQQVEVSILNTEKNTYTLYIYRPDGELVFKERLGNNASLGKRFDFEYAQKGKYTFTFKTDSGQRSSYTVKTGR